MKPASEEYTDSVNCQNCGPSSAESDVQETRQETAPSQVERALIHPAADDLEWRYCYGAWSN
jgi:hypothetical protein